MYDNHSKVFIFLSFLCLFLYLSLPHTHSLFLYLYLSIPFFPPYCVSMWVFYLSTFLSIDIFVLVVSISDKDIVLSRNQRCIDRISS